MKNQRTTPGRSAVSTPSKHDIRAQAAHIIEVTRAKWRHDDIDQHLSAAASAQPPRDRLRRELFDNLDTALAVAELMAHLFGYERDGRALESLPGRLVPPAQCLETLSRARCAARAGNDDFYGAGARRQRVFSVVRRGAHSWKR